MRAHGECVCLESKALLFSSPPPSSSSSYSLPFPFYPIRRTLGAAAVGVQSVEQGNEELMCVLLRIAGQVARVLPDDVKQPVRRKLPALARVHFAMNVEGRGDGQCIN